MIQNMITALLVLAIVIPVGVFFLGERKAHRFKSMLAVNVVTFFGILLFSTVFLFSGHAMAETAIGGGVTDQGLKYIGAAISTGLATVGAGIATGSAASAALGALSENEGIMGRALIFVALAEGIAIYGLLISLMILNS